MRCLFLLLLILQCCTLNSPGTAADMIYTDHGKQITKAEYDADMLSNQAKQYLHEGKDKEFIEAATKAYELAPNNGLILETYGTALGKAGRYEEARDTLLKGLSILPGNPFAWCALAAIYTSMGNNAEAIKCYDTYLQKFPTDINVTKVQSIVTLLKASASSANSSSDDYFDSACNEHYRWPPELIPVAVHIASGSQYRGYRDSFVDDVKSAFADWSAAANGLIAFKFVDQPDAARIKVSWTDTTKDFSQQGEGGECVPYAAGKVLTGATIKLLTTELITPYLRDERLKMVALHEIGHSIGILGHSIVPGDVMYMSETLSESGKLSKRDAQTVQRIYSPSPGN